MKNSLTLIFFIVLAACTTVPAMTVYRHDLLGIAISYPKDWTIPTISENIQQALVYRKLDTPRVLPSHPGSSKILLNPIACNTWSSSGRCTDEQAKGFTLALEKPSGPANAMKVMKAIIAKTKKAETNLLQTGLKDLQGPYRHSLQGKDFLRLDIHTNYGKPLYTSYLVAVHKGFYLELILNAKSKQALQSLETIANNLTVNE